MSAIYGNAVGGGGSAKINGIIEEYKVATGGAVSAGDFVSFVQTYIGPADVTTDMFAQPGPIIDQNIMSSIEMGDGRVLVVSVDTDTVLGHIISFDAANMTCVSKVIETDGISSNYPISNIVPVGNNRYMFVALRQSLCVYIVEVAQDDMTIIAGDSRTSGTPSSGTRPKLFALDDGRYCYAWKNTSTNVVKLQLFTYTLTDGALSITWEVSSNVGTAQEDTQNFDAVYLGNNKILSIYSSDYNSTNAVVSTIHTEGVTHATTEVLGITGLKQCAVDALATGKCLSVITKGADLWFLLLSVQDDDTVIATSYEMTNASGLDETITHPNMVRVDADKVFLSTYISGIRQPCFGPATVTENEGGTLSVTWDAQTTTDVLSQPSNRLPTLLRSDGSVVINGAMYASPYETVAYLTGKICEPTVATYDGVRSICGVAKNDGTEGQLINVVVPE